MLVLSRTHKCLAKEGWSVVKKILHAINFNVPYILRGKRSLSQEHNPIKTKKSGYFVMMMTYLVYY